MKYKIEILMDNPFIFNEVLEEAKKHIQTHLMDNFYDNPWLLVGNPENKSHMLFQLVSDSEVIKEPET